MPDRDPESHPRVKKAGRVVGRTLVLRDAAVSDAQFLLALRTDDRASRFLSETEGDVRAQVTWLEAYAASREQAYFVVELRSGEPLGCVRLYDPRGGSFCWGSWVFVGGAPRHAAIESALMVYAFGIDHLGFRQAHFDVRKGNGRVWQFHERFGAERAGETAESYRYRIGGSAIARSRERFRRFLPDSVTVEHMS